MTIGTRRDLDTRLGMSMQPRIVVLRAKTGFVNATGGRLVCELFARDTDPEPLAEPRFVVTALAPLLAGEPRYKLDLSREAVAQLATLAAAAPVNTSTRITQARGVRVAAWTCAWQFADQSRAPLFYGLVNIYVGATGA